MKKLRKGVVLWAAVVAASVGSIGIAEAAALSKPRVVRAVMAKSPPRIDGILDDACWKDAQEITDFVIIGTSNLTAWQSFGYVCYDDSHLYIGMKSKTLRPAAYILSA
jgi:hypothetical protein